MADLSASLAVVIGCVILAATIAGCGGETPEERREQQRRGFHCLSTWDGSHRGVVKFVRDRVRDPSSFEHVETSITPVSDSGEHELLMRYRATNGFGGVSVGLATATIQNSNCVATITAVE